MWHEGRVSVLRDQVTSKVHYWGTSSRMIYVFISDRCLSVVFYKSSPCLRVSHLTNGGDHPPDTS